MTHRPDYCPIGGEPCQSLCEAPCGSRKPLTDEQIREWWASENGLEDCDMGKLVDFTALVREVEAKLGIEPAP